MHYRVENLIKEIITRKHSFSSSHKLSVIDCCWYREERDDEEWPIQDTYDIESYHMGVDDGNYTFAIIDDNGSIIYHLQKGFTEFKKLNDRMYEIDLEPSFLLYFKEFELSICFHLMLQNNLNEITLHKDSLMNELPILSHAI